MERRVAVKLIDAVCIALVVCTFAHLALAWAGMPDAIPVHYGFGGEADDWGDKSRAFIVPVLEAGVYLMIAVAERHPNSWNTGVRVTDENRERVYRILGNLLATVKSVVTIGFAAVSAVQVGGGPQPRFLFPAIVASLVGGVVFWAIQLRRAR